MALSSLTSFLIQHASNFLGSMVEEHQRSSYLRRVAPGKNESYAGNQNHDKLDAGNQNHDKLDTSNQNHDKLDAGNQNHDKLDAGNQNHDKLDAGNQNHDQNFSRRG